MNKLAFCLGAISGAIGIAQHIFTPNVAEATYAVAVGCFLILLGVARSLL